MKPRIGDQCGVEARDGDFGADHVSHVGVWVVWRVTGIEGFVPALENEKYPLQIDLVAEADGSVGSGGLVKITKIK